MTLQKLVHYKISARLWNNLVPFGSHQAHFGMKDLPAGLQKYPANSTQENQENQSSLLDPLQIYISFLVRPRLIASQSKYHAYSSE